MIVGELPPGKGIGKFQFGLSRAEIRGLLRGVALNTYEKEPETDFFSEEGLILGFDEHDIFEFVEVANPSDATLNGEHLLRLGLQPTLELLKKFGGQSRTDGSSFFLDGLCVVLFAPEGHLESVAAYKEGYYER